MLSACRSVLPSLLKKILPVAFVVSVSFQVAAADILFAEVVSGSRPYPADKIVQILRDDNHNVNHVFIDPTQAPISDPSIYSQVWVWDMSASSDVSPSQMQSYQLIANWYLNRGLPNLILDARAQAALAVHTIRSPLDPQLFGTYTAIESGWIQNYARQLALRGGGLVLMTDHATAFTQGINEINRRINISDFTGFSYVEPYLAEIDPGSALGAGPMPCLDYLDPAMVSSWETVLGDGRTCLLANTSVGVPPFNVQPNGLVLYPVAWVAPTSTHFMPVISSSLRPLPVPIADAGPSQVVEQTSAAGADVTLDGSGSSSPTGSPLTYDWTTALGTHSGISPTVSFLPGAHNVELIVSDSTGISEPDSTTITVRDTTPPEITAPGDIAICNDPGEVAAIVSYPDPVATDASGPVLLTQTAGLPSGTAFVVGIHTITYEASDDAGNSSTASFMVTVTDCEAPEISTSDLIAEATGPTTDIDIAAVTTATDNVGVITLGVDNAGPFPIGSTTVTWTACDAADNCSSATQVITINAADTTPPVISAPADMNVCNDPGQASAIVGYPYPTAIDDSGSVDLLQTAGPASGSAFPIGSTIVSFDAIDAAGNVSSASWTVTVNDCEAPVISTQDLSANASGATTVVDIAAVTTASDNVGVISLIADNNGPFPVGSTTVTWTACDDAGNCANAIQVVTIVDNAPPLSCDLAYPSVSKIWPPNHKMVDITLEGVAGNSPDTTILVTGVTQDEPLDSLGDGDTSPDAAIGSENVLSLRAERAGKGNGRVYTIHFRADSGFKSCSGTVKVGVPQSRKSEAVDDGTSYSSL